MPSFTVDVSEALADEIEASAAALGQPVDVWLAYAVSAHLEWMRLHGIARGAGKPLDAAAPPPAGSPAAASAAAVVPQFGAPRCPATS